MRRVVIFIFCCLCSLFSIGQIARQTLLPAYIKTGAYSIKQSDVFSFGTNQAALARVSSFSAGVFSERKFMLSELNLFSGAFALPTHSGNFGLQLHRFGNSVYSDMQAGLAYARKLAEHVDVGIQFNYYTLQIAGYGRAAAVNFEAGALFHFTDQLHGGVHVYNPTSSKLGKDDEESLPAVYSAGLGYDASDNFFINTEIEKTENTPVNVNVSLQYKFADRFLARGGVATATSIYFLGLGFTQHSFRIDATASVHPQLGISPGLLLIYTKQNKE